jgi:hypothetical protein
MTERSENLAPQRRDLRRHRRMTAKFANEQPLWDAMPETSDGSMQRPAVGEF